jgi:catechol 2,3-dioxygenase-like lactoylglutathione lyase family enzyme
MAHFTGIGHLHLKVADIERAARFYEKGLGMQRIAVKHDGKLIALLLPDSLDVLTLSEGSIGAESGKAVNRAALWQGVGERLSLCFC